METRGRKKSGLTKNELAARSRKNTDTKNLTMNGEVLGMLKQIQEARSNLIGVQLTLKQTMTLILREELKR